MYSTKEQANIYLERINSRGKSVSTIMLIIIPLAILLLAEIQKNYNTIQIYLSGRTSNFQLSQAKKNATDSIAQYNKQISDFYTKLPTYILSLKDTLKAKEIKKFIQNIEVKKSNQKQKFRFYNTAKRIQNDSLESKLSSLKIPLELPILKKTASLTIRTVVLIVMLLLSALLAYLYSGKLYVIDLIKKFIALKPLDSGPELKDTCTDLQLKLPIWCLPLKNNFFNSGPLYDISNLMSISKTSIRLNNLVMAFLWCLSLILNFLLVKLNWDIHYKLYHQHYSPFIAFCFFLFLFNTMIVCRMLIPVFSNQKIKVMPPKANSMSRVQFIAMAIGTIGCFVFEPVYGRFKNGAKWFHKPRSINDKKNILEPLAIGFYTNISKSKKKKHLVYYISANQQHFMKCAPKPEKFKANLKEISFNTLLRKPAYLLNLNENVLLHFLETQKWKAIMLLRVMNRYLEVTNHSISLQFIDRYTTVYRNAVISKSKGVSKHVKIIGRIGEIKNNPFDYLPEKYLLSVNTIKPDKKQEFTKTKADLHAQLLKRITGWNDRLNYTGHSRSLM